MFEALCNEANAWFSQYFFHISHWGVLQKVKINEVDSEKENNLKNSCYIHPTKTMQELTNCKALILSLCLFIHLYSFYSK